MLLLHSGGHKKGMYYVIGYKFKYCLKRYSCNYKKSKHHFIVVNGNCFVKFTSENKSINRRLFN